MYWSPPRVDTTLACSLSYLTNDIRILAVSSLKASSMGKDKRCARSERCPARGPPFCRNDYMSWYSFSVNGNLASFHLPCTHLNNSSRYQNNSRCVFCSLGRSLDLVTTNCRSDNVGIGIDICSSVSLNFLMGMTILWKRQLGITDGISS